MEREHLTHEQKLHELFAEIAACQNMSWLAVRDDYLSDDSVYKNDIDAQIEEY